MSISPTITAAVVVPALITGCILLIIHVFNVRRQKKQTLSTARADIHVAFAEMLAYLESGNFKDPAIFLRSVTAETKAIRGLQSQLGWCKRRRFKRDHEKYEEARVFAQRQNDQDVFTTNDAETFKKAIEALLSYAP